MTYILGLILFVLVLTSVTDQQSISRLGLRTCPTGFQSRGQSSCYHIESTSTLSRDDARIRCSTLASNSHLVDITSSQEDGVIRSLALAENKTRNYWIGLEQRNHTFRWMDGSHLNLTVWHRPERQIDIVISDCVSTIPPWNHWNETSCNHTYQFLCEGDIRDSVCNGVNTTFNSSCYFTSNGTNGTRDQAKDYCDQRRAHLVFIETAEENSFIFNFTGGNVSYWIGLARHGNWSVNRREFAWMNGDSLSYSNLDSVQGGSGCVQIQSIDNYTSWKEDRCNERHGFICEKKVHSSSVLLTHSNSIPNPEYIIREAISDDVFDCIFMCVATPNCMSLATGPDGEHFRCVLANAPLATLRPEPGYIYYTIPVEPR